METADAKENTLSPLQKLDPYISPSTIVVRSPGRINLIGEHTDYNQGFVLPAAIDKAAYLALTPREDDQINLYSIDLHDQYSTNIHDFERTEKSWPNYILGVADQFRQRGKLTKGFRCGTYRRCADWCGTVFFCRSRKCRSNGIGCHAEYRLR